MTDLPCVLVLMGPTASGKTALSLKLVDEFPFEIISVDSALVYRTMNIGTSKPSQDILNQYPHHLIDICDPSDRYSAASFRTDALAIMADIVSRNKIPLLVGGTMLYFRALLNGISQMPSADVDVRKEIEAELADIGLAALHKKLSNIDPVAAEKIHPNDPQRIQRALEVFKISGIPISEWWKKDNQQNIPYQILKIAISTSERTILHERIAQRFVEMLNEGFVDEVAGLKNRGDLNLDMPSMRSVGYRQIWQHLDGEFNYDEMQFKGIVATRQLAKRQLTWLRTEQNLNWFYSDEKNFQNNVLKIVSQIPRLT